MRHDPMPTRSRYIRDGAPRHCAACGQKFDGRAWRHGQKYFCDQACAEDLAPDPRAERVAAAG